MPETSQGGTGLNGLKRINTGLSESGHQPRTGGPGSGRLSLHIPNAYPRALSPRSPNSRNTTPQSSRQPSPIRATSESTDRPSTSVFSALKGTPLPNPGQSRPPSGCSSSQNPRVRVFRRDSSLITVHQIDDDSSPLTSSQGQQVELRPTSTSAPILKPLLAVKSFFAVHETSSSSARDFLARERNFFVWLRLASLLAILSASLILQLQLPDMAHSLSTEPRRRRGTDTSPVDWDDIPVSSKAFAGIFFALSLLALGTGLADYLSAERELEKEQVDFDETEGVFLNDGHTSRIVHGVVLIIGAGIIASALWLIAS